MKKYLFLLGISLMWGSQFYFAEQVLDTVEPMALAAIRSTIGACTLTLLAILLPHSSAPVKTGFRWRRYTLYVVIALLEAVLPFFLVAWGQNQVNSSLASILIGTTPLWTVLIVWLLFRERLHRNQAFGVMLGFIGVMIIFIPHISYSDATIFSGETAGLVALLMAAVSYASALILMQYLPTASVVLSMRNILWCAVILLWPAVLVMDNSWPRLYPADLLPLFIIGIFQTGLVYWLYTLLVHREGPVFASFSNYLVPLVGIVLGSFFLNESITISMIIGVIVVIGSIMLSRTQPYYSSYNDKI